MMRQSPITIALITLSIAVSLFSQLGSKIGPVHQLFFSSFIQPDLPSIFMQTQSLEIFQGQVWRLFTPMFLHFGIIHLIFNMLWLKDLGGIIEFRMGSFYLLALVLVTSALSNIAQFLWSGPLFGGMSGVVYGLLGFLWIRGQLDPYFNIVLNRQVVIMMIAWFFLCLTGLMGNVANMAHGLGLATGMAWGYLTSGHLGSDRK
ncbi:MAG: rhomboid family intramembrane serine protease [Deltaproteobacteria bacterium]|nr:rhomboid family intramembrane serine protease [Deltaproteobacteria bacterium]